MPMLGPGAGCPQLCFTLSTCFGPLLGAVVTLTKGSLSYSGTITALTGAGRLVCTPQGIPAGTWNWSYVSPNLTYWPSGSGTVTVGCCGPTTASQIVNPQPAYTCACQQYLTVGALSGCSCGTDFDSLMPFTLTANDGIGNISISATISDVDCSSYWSGLAARSTTIGCPTCFVGSGPATANLLYQMVCGGVTGQFQLRIFYPGNVTCNYDYVSGTATFSSPFISSNWATPTSCSPFSITFTFPPQPPAPNCIPTWMANIWPAGLTVGVTP